MELWDIYDVDRRPKGYTHIRGEEMNPGDYHITVNVWIRNSKGEYLLTKRTPNKEYGGYWECTGGSVISGDTSFECALKEVKEETGLVLAPENGKLIWTYNRDVLYGMPDFCDVWFFKQDFDISEVVFQEGETCDAMWATPMKILEMEKSREFVPMIDYIEKVFSYKK